MLVSLIVAAADNDVIGKSGKIPWRLPSEQVIFKKITMGHPIIMGRKTHESIGRALPGRYNIVVTRQNDYQAAEGCKVVATIEEALNAAKNAPGSDEIFIIGGVEIYNQTLDLADRIYITRVHAKVDGDTFFHFDSSKWQEVSKQEHKADSQNKYDYDFIILDRK